MSITDRTVLACTRSWPQTPEPPDQKDNFFFPFETDYIVLDVQELNSVDQAVLEL